MRRKGFVYTIFTIVLVGSIIALVALQTTPTKNYRVAEKVKTDEMTYFLKGLSEDLERTTQISGKRAIISMIDKEVLNGTFIADVNDSIKVAMVEGVYNGTPLSLTTDNTLDDWEVNMNDLAQKRGANALIDFTQTTVVPSTAFSLKVESFATATVFDPLLEIAIRRNISASEVISIDGLEDPFNTINSNTYISQRFEKCATLEGVDSSQDWYAGTAYITNATNFSGINGNGKVAIVHNASAVINRGTMEGFISQANVSISSLIPGLRDDIVVGVENAQGAIINNSFVVVNNETVYVTNVTEAAHTHTCYFVDPLGPSFLDRLEGSYATSGKYSSSASETIGIGSYIYVRALPSEMQYGSEDYRLDYYYWKNFP